MKKLIAQRPVLYQGRTYQRGETLPADNRTMAEAWLRAGSARWAETAAPAVTEPEGKKRK